MSISEVEPYVATRRPETAITDLEYETWRHWPVHWAGIWVGALGAVAGIVLTGLGAIAVGAQLLDPAHRLVDLDRLSWGTMAFGVCGAFFAFVVGGWIAVKVAGILRSEPAMLHGAIVWLVALPMIVLTTVAGGGGYIGGWFSGVGANPAVAISDPFDRPGELSPLASPTEMREHAAAWSEYREDLQKWRRDTPKATRAAALCAITSLLLGLMGSVVGGWMGSGEPMTLTYHKTRARVPTRPV